MTGERPEVLDEKPEEGFNWEYGPYLRAFEILNKSRRQEKTSGMLAGQPTVQITTCTLSLESILAYAREFPDDVDDIRRFIRIIQIIDEEFLNHGSRRGQTKSNR